MRVLLLAVAAVLLVWPPVSAQTLDSPPDGLPVGKWILSPYFEGSFEADDNVFRRSDENDPESDQITTLTGGVLANLPVRNSLITLGYEASRLSYKENEFSRDLDQEVWAEIALRFSSQDELIMRERYNRGVTDLQTIDQGGELVFQGEPFNVNRWELELTRAVPRRQGYSVRVARTDLNFDGEPAADADCEAEDLTCFPFFDYRGFDMSAEYRQPVGRNQWFLVRQEARRFNHYAANRPDLVGIPFRHEEQDYYQVGLRGSLSGLHPFFVVVGYGSLRFTEVRKGGTPEDFNGIVTAADLSYTLSRGGRLQFALDRRALPSNFNTYYLVNQVTLGFEHRWMRQARYGVDLLLGYNEYGDLLRDDEGNEIFDCGGQIREDRRQRLQGRLEWLAHARVGVVTRAGLDRRSSNCGNSDFTAVTVSTGVRIGWF